MTFPAIFFSTGSVFSASLGLVGAMLMAIFRQGAYGRRRYVCRNCICERIFCVIYHLNLHIILSEGTDVMSYDIDYLTLLSQQYPTVKAASTEIIRLQSRQKLPKLTEHFMSDIHGEYESFFAHIKKCLRCNQGQDYANLRSYVVRT